MGLANSPMAGATLRVASGNFVTARPLGVVGGVDLMHTGVVRKVDVSAIRARLDQGEMVLLSPLGYSPTGEIFNLTLENVAAEAAMALGAEKLIFLMDTVGLNAKSGGLLRELTVVDAEKLMEKPAKLSTDAGFYLPWAIKACKNTVARAHLISRHVDGALLQELFTRSGIGSMISKGTLQQLRGARIDDVGAILQLIEPLETEGVLVRRNRELLEMEIDRFAMLEHDGIKIGCAALYPFAGEKAGELACLVVHHDYRDAGYGDALLQHIEADAKKQGLKKLFVLTTRTAHWFVERGFEETGVDKLPPQKQALYNWQRKSKIFVKKIT